MKAAVIFFVSFLGFLLFGWVVARLTHVIDVFSIPTISSQPTFQPGDLVFASRWKTPDTNTFLCFRNTKDHDIYISRCVAKEYQTIEIRNGDVYLDGRLFDQPDVYNDYLITTKQLSTIGGFVKNNNNPVHNYINDTWVISLTTTELKKYHLKLKRDIYRKGEADAEFFADFKKQGYTPDNLGPVRVPHKCYFVMGDNRHNAFDSRYLGFIKQSQIVSTVLR